jgi:hypothetical protein
LYVGLIAPFIAFALTHAEARKMLGLAATPGPERYVAAACWAAVIALAIAYSIRQVLFRRWPQQAPKLLFLAAALSSVWVIFSPPVAARLSFPLFAVAVTAWHNIQYHAIVWFYHRNRYHSNGAPQRAEFGIAPRLSSSILVYALSGIAFALLYRLGGCALGSAPACDSFTMTHSLGSSGLTITDLATGFFWGFALHHYYLDQRIWRLRSDKSLRRDLRLPAT